MPFELIDPTFIPMVLEKRFLTKVASSPKKRHDPRSQNRGQSNNYFLMLRASFGCLSQWGALCVVLPKLLLKICKVAAYAIPIFPTHMLRPLDKGYIDAS